MYHRLVSCGVVVHRGEFGYAGIQCEQRAGGGDSKFITPGARELADSLFFFNVMKTKEKPIRKSIETTAYCSCGYCCNWEWGISLGPLNAYLGILPKPFPLRFRRRPAATHEHQPARRRHYLVDKFWTATEIKGHIYDGLTASGSVPRQTRRSIIHPSIWTQPKVLLPRLVTPWTWLGQTGTAAADTEYYPFGTQMHVPRHGWVTVEDTGGAIKGPHRVDLYYQSHGAALVWGRRDSNVLIVPPGQSRLDRLPGALRPIAKTLDALKHALY